MPIYVSKAEAALRLENRHLRNELAKAWREAETLRAALEHVTRECGALNKGPVAVEIARAALSRSAPPSADKPQEPSV